MIELFWVPCRDNRISQNRAQKQSESVVTFRLFYPDCLLLRYVNSYRPHWYIVGAIHGHTSVASITDAIETAVEAAIATAKHCGRYVELRCLH